MPEVVVEQREHSLYITLNRPEVRNALNENMQVAITEALELAAANMEVRAVVLTGEGQAFCSGADTRRIVKQEGVFEGSSASTTRQGYKQGVQRMSRAFYNCEVPIIAAVNGAALGLGFDLATQCDIRIASTKAFFSEAFITAGLIPGDGGFWYLPRIVGYSKAVELTVTGRRIDAETAERLGLVAEVVEPAELLPCAGKLASEIAARSPHTVRLSKRLIRDSDHCSFHEALEMGALAQAVLTGTEDQREAVLALKERREGQFQGR